MSELLIKPLRAYEDRGIIRDTDNEPYAAPVWLAKELEQLKLCKIVGEAEAALDLAEVVVEAGVDLAKPEADPKKKVEKK